jgi:SAM-dependent methyltransferase
LQEKSLSQTTPTESDSLTFTGERFTPETAGEIWYEHWHRYCAILPLARGKRVLDAACGEGYGSALLADEAAEVLGVDLSDEAVAHALARYRGKSNLHFMQASVARLPLPDASRDLIVSFETIEHLLEQEAMLAEFRRVLKPDGLLIISSPNKPVYSDERDYHNEFHVRELTRGELAAMLAPGFPRQRWYGQRLQFHSLIWSESLGSTTPLLETLSVADGRVAKLALAPKPMYFIVICGGSAATLPEANRISLFADQDQSIYREFERTTRAERKIYQMYLEQEEIIKRLLAQVAELKTEGGVVG